MRGQELEYGLQCVYCERARHEQGGRTISMAGVIDEPNLELPSNLLSLDIWIMLSRRGVTLPPYETAMLEVMLGDSRLHEINLMDQVSAPKDTRTAKPGETIVDRFSLILNVRDEELPRPGHLYFSAIVNGHRVNELGINIGFPTTPQPETK